MAQDLKFNSNVIYLEETDITPSGITIITKEGVDLAKGKACVVLIASAGCGHCVHFKPAFQEVANQILGKSDSIDLSDMCVFAVASASSQKGRKAAMLLGSNPPFLDGIEVRGYPTVLLKKENGTWVMYEGDRSVEDFKNWIKQNCN